MPQPLSSFPSIRQQYNIRWGYETLTERTELAQLVAQVIAVGAQIEYAQDRAVSTIVGHDNDLAFAMFASLKSPTVRKSTMSELAEDRLSGAIRTTFNVAISAYDTVSGHRNDFAHHIGVSAINSLTRSCYPIPSIVYTTKGVCSNTSTGWMLEIRQPMPNHT